MIQLSYKIFAMLMNLERTEENLERISNTKIHQFVELLRELYICSIGTKGWREAQKSHHAEHNTTTPGWS